MKVNMKVNEGQSQAVKVMKVKRGYRGGVVSAYFVDYS